MQRSAASRVSIVVRVYALLLVVGCKAAAAPPRDVPEPRVDVARDPALPAGLYFRNGYVHCEECPAPRWAAIAGVFEDAKVAREATNALRDGARVDAGYPLVVHTDELALADTSRVGIVVIAELFEREADAKASDDLEVVELLDFDAAFEIETQREWDARRFVVQLDGTQSVPAFDPAKIRELEHTLATQPWNSREDYLARRNALVDALPTACRIESDRLFVFTDARFERDDLLGNTYAWQPVTCDDGTPAYVHHSDTRRHTIVLPGPDGPVLEQIVEVTCDVPTRQRWAWRGNHRDRASETTADPPSSRC